MAYRLGDLWELTVSLALWRTDGGKLVEEVDMGKTDGVGRGDPELDRGKGGERDC